MWCFGSDGISANFCPFYYEWRFIAIWYFVFMLKNFEITYMIACVTLHLVLKPTGLCLRQCSGVLAFQSSAMWHCYITTCLRWQIESR
jgi:hypothetical protein